MEKEEVSREKKIPVRCVQKSEPRASGKSEVSDMDGTKIVKKELLRDKAGEVRNMLNSFWNSA